MPAHVEGGRPAEETAFGLCVARRRNQRPKNYKTLLLIQLVVVHVVGNTFSEVSSVVEQSAAVR